jgi:hypothetical protein
MKMKFDKDKCLKLLKERKSLQKEGKLLRDYDKAKNDELISYLILVEDQIFWESRKKYCQILDLFVRKKITLDQLFKQFYRLRGSNLRSATMWKEKLEEEAFVVFPKSTEINIQLNPESGGFIKIISNLHSWTNLCDPDITLEMNLKQPELIGYGISEEFLRFTIEEDFLPQLEKYCKES